MPPVTGRTNLATVTYPVILATEAQRNATDNVDDMIWNVDGGPPCINQYSILLTYRDVHLRPGTTRLPVFDKLNKIGVKRQSSIHTDRQVMRHSLMKSLKFAGIAFTGVEEGYGNGAPRQIASVIGGSHTVMSYNNLHSDTPMRPGSMVRWTLPLINSAQKEKAVLVSPLAHFGACSKGVFAELEEVKPSTNAQDIGDLICNSTDAKILRLKEELNCKCEDGVPCPKLLGILTNIMEVYAEVQEREIGTIIQDNGKGSIDIRLK
jgi:hypothetical protein